MSYHNYYRSLTGTDWQRLQELLEIAVTDVLPVPAIYIVEIERYGYHVDLCSGEVHLDTGDRTLNCGHVSGYYDLLDVMIKSRATRIDCAMVEARSDCAMDDDVMPAAVEGGRDK